MPGADGGQGHGGGELVEGSAAASSDGGGGATGRERRRLDDEPCAPAAPSDAEVKAAIWRHLADPSFAAYVARVEALWDEVAAEAERVGVGGGEGSLRSGS